ncbi:MAG: thioredoxin family protein [Pirellulaceae bacterium]|nr:thioredoxin family protein [Pirellulaceae bacterium]
MVTLIVVGESHARAADAVSKEGEIAWSGSLTTAWRAAREQQRPLLLFVTMDTCVHCQKMKQTTLKDAAVQSDLKERFIPVALNVKDEPEFIKTLRVRTFPTLVVIQPNGDVVESISGYQTPKQLREKLAPIVRQAARGKPDAAAR